MTWWLYEPVHIHARCKAKQSTVAQTRTIFSVPGLIENSRMEFYRRPGGYIQCEPVHTHARIKQSGVQRLRAQCNRDQHFRIVILEQPL